ncbi:centromere protein x [Anaeramoeba ignava]|uniref:Centromere protein x n=1 Tax=Anaeramoeba ignava TaxID=1746090 RepID=A0A9Q0REY9_ANAIG|nr:centromere protein x [Anaeramoeba ignava]
MEETFNPSTLSTILRKNFKNEKTKISKDTLECVAEFLRLFVGEAIDRASAKAQIENSENIEPEHLEKIIPQLLLDF